MAGKFGALPSEILSIEDDYTAYCVNQAIYLFGTMVEAELEAIPMGTGKKASERRQAKQEAKLKELLGIGERKAAHRFSDPASLIKKEK